MTDNNTKTTFKANNGTGFLFVPKFTLSDGQRKAGLQSKGYLVLDNGDEIKITCFKKTGDKGIFWSLQIDDDPVRDLKAKVAVLESKLGVIPVVKEEPVDSEDHPM